MYTKKFFSKYGKRKISDPVEVVDNGNRPLCILPLPEVRRQSLRHRTALVLIFNPEHKIYLQKRSLRKKLYPGRLDLSITAPVWAGESMQDAAVRALREEMGMYADRAGPLKEISTPQKIEMGFAMLFSLECRNRIMDPDLRGTDSGLFVDKEELDYLARNFKEMLTPNLFYFWEKNLIFPCPEL